MPHIEVVRQSRVKPECAWLARSARNVRSQEGQDGILERIFQVIGPANHTCLEFGAWDGVHLSNTWNLINTHGWSGILIEGDPERFQALARTYAGVARVARINRFVGFGAEDSLDAILAGAGAPADLDLASIDIDGNDWHVWESLERHRPRVVLIEFNPTVPNDVAFVQDRDPAVQQGCSLRALVQLGKRKGYELVCAHVTDAFFVQAELFPRFGIADNSIDALYDNHPHLTRLFQGYDGTFFMAGNLRVQWKNIPLRPDELQPLPAARRRYGVP